MDEMAKEMRNRFALALVFTPAILAWSSVGKSIFGRYLGIRFGLDRNVWQLLLSLPGLWAARGFFTGAAAALRQRTLDMNVLVAVAIGTMPSQGQRWEILTPSQRVPLYSSICLGSRGLPHRRRRS